MAGQARILVVEDERIVALNVRRQLTALGYDVPQPVASGEAALAEAERSRPDLVLMDIHIEGKMDGIEVARLIESRYKIPIVFLTAYSEEATLQRARAVRPYGYLLKPFSERELHATIQVALERHRAEALVLDREQRLRLALDAADLGTLEVDVAARAVRHTAHASRPLSVEQDSFDGGWSEFLDRVHEDDRAAVAAALDRAMAEDAPYDVEFRGLNPDGSTSWLNARGKAYEDKGHRHLIGIVQDITRARSAEEHMRQAATVFESTAEAIVVLDENRRVTTVNQGFVSISGYTRDEVVSQELFLLRADSHPQDFLDRLWHELELQGHWQGELRGWTKDGSAFPAWTNVSVVRKPDGVVSHYVVVFSDISSVREAADRLRHLAHHDPLTDLPNRLLALDRLDHALERARRRDRKVALLFLDLDRFKWVNDTIGHHGGDELLRVVAQRLQGALRTEDTAARLGGDEFLVILDQVDDRRHVATVADKLIAILSAPARIAGQEVSTSVSIGISMFPDDASSRDDLIRAADTAMYAAKERGRNNHVFYASAMTAGVSRFAALEADLRRGLSEREFVLHYQPVVALSTGEVTGVEALLRWQHPERGLLGANEIIPLAEESGLIVEIGQWVFREACEQACRWRAAGVAPLRIGINCSVHQLRNRHLVASTLETLTDTRMDPEMLELEITESAVQHEASCAGALLALRRLGLRLAIDDFGMGHSCLKSLKHFPFQRLKIDQTFVRDVTEDSNSAAIAAAVLALGKQMGLDVTAEGVEQPEQAAFMHRLGCEDVQGFLYSRPVEAAAIPGIVARGYGHHRTGVMNAAGSATAS